MRYILYGIITVDMTNKLHSSWIELGQGLQKYFSSGIQTFSQAICHTKRGIVHKENEAQMLK